MDIERKLEIQQKHIDKLEAENIKLKEQIVISENKLNEVSEKYDSFINELKESKQTYESLISELRGMISEYSTLKEIKKELTK